MKLILGSSSKYRRSILENHGYIFEVVSPDVDEKKIRSEDLYQLPLILARAKSQNLVQKINEPALVITSDIIVVCDGKLCEKPESEAEARAFLKKYSEGHPAETVCSLVVVNTETGKRVEGVDIAKVYFHELPQEFIDLFIKEGDPYTRAGGFGVQVPMFQPYLKKVEGTIESIVGMPIHLLEKLLREHDYNPKS
jgi:septum formation protein